MAMEQVHAGNEIWDKLTALAASGDCRAMKLYYELLEKKQRAHAADAPDMAQMAAIRRAVFGEKAMREDFDTGGDPPEGDDEDAD